MKDFNRFMKGLVPDKLTVKTFQVKGKNKFEAKVLAMPFNILGQTALPIMFNVPKGFYTLIGNPEFDDERWSVKLIKRVA